MTKTDFTDESYELSLKDHQQLIFIIDVATGQTFKGISIAQGSHIRGAGTFYQVMIDPPKDSKFMEWHDYANEQWNKTEIQAAAEFINAWQKWNGWNNEQRTEELKKAAADPWYKEFDKDSFPDQQETEL